MFAMKSQKSAKRLITTNWRAPAHSLNHRRLMSLESTGARVEQAARQLQIYGRAVPVTEVIEKIDAVNADSVVGTARRIFATDPTLAAIGPADHLEDLAAIRARLN